MLDVLYQAMVTMLDVQLLLYVILGAFGGLILGVIPGISPLLGMALLIPFVHGVDPLIGVAFLVALNSGGSQGGSQTAVLLGTPGDEVNAATTLDGIQLTRQGKAGIAMSAALSACAMGAIFGGIALAFMLPNLRPIVQALGSPEFLMIGILSLVMASSLAGNSVLKGLITAGVGLLLSLVGIGPLAGSRRFTFGVVDLWDGLSMVPVILGLFAVAEMIELAVQGGTLAQNNAPPKFTVRGLLSDSLLGLQEALRRWWLIMRCGVIGVTTGLIPGLGGVSATFLAYAHAKQTSKHPELFGKGAIEGVIAPEAANDAVSGGALATTLALGIPGSASTAILLGAMMMMGLEPGPGFLDNNMPVAYVVIGSGILANIFASLLGLPLVGLVGRLAQVQSTTLVPLVLSVVVAGSYLSRGNMFDVAVTMAMGALGYLMKVLDYPRSVLLVCFVIGRTIEQHLALTSRVHGLAFFQRPVTLAIMVLLVGTVIVRWRQNRTATA